jgi:hypothetical protein
MWMMVLRETLYIEVDTWLHFTKLSSTVRNSEFIPIVLFL